MKKTVLFIMIFFALYSCEKTIPIDVEEQDPKIVVNCLFDNTSPLMVDLSRSAMIDDATGPVIMPNADIKLFENGNFIDQLENMQVGEYYGSQTLKPGNTYRLDIETDIGDVTVTNTMPDSVPIISLDSIKETQIVDDAWGEAMDALMFYFTFQDLPGDHYYALKLFRNSEYSGYYEVGNMFYYEYNYRSSNSGIDGGSSVEFYQYLRFTDGLFNGTTKTYKFGIINDYYMIPENNDSENKFKLQLFSISEDYYRYLQTVEAYWNAEGNFFAESINLFSNVEGGLGIFAGATMSEIEVEALEIIRR
jgi:hypothetical protein